MDIQKDSEGRWVGEDGFIVPATFAEFYTQYPDYGLIMARKSLRYAAPDDLADLSQEIWSELLRKKAVERFDPVKLGGCNERRFFFYITRCCSNVSVSRWKDEAKEPVTTALGIDNASTAESTGTVNEEQLHAYGSNLTVSGDIHGYLYIVGLSRYLTEAGHADLVNLMDGIMTEKNHTEAGEATGMNRSQLTMAMKRLRKLAREYEGVHG